MESTAAAGGPHPIAPTRTRLSQRKKLLFVVGSVSLSLLLMEGVACILFATLDPKYELFRRHLLGDQAAQLLHKHNTIAQPYLVYIHAPGYTRDGILQHNEHGYRGGAVPLERTPDTLRVLFLGGSTTYCTSVSNPDEAYPAQVGEYLKVNLPSHIKGVEVINGGLSWGTTAEMLTHYLFKWRYYRPDIVVINTGGNDAQPMDIPNYQPDYSHWRQNLPQVVPPNPKWILHSRLVSAFVIRVFYSSFLDGGHFLRIGDDPPAANWYTKSNISNEDLAFRKNLESAIREMHVQGAQILLVPFRLNPIAPPYSEVQFREIKRNERILMELADEFDLAFAPFPASVIRPHNWADECHLTPEGCREKAEHITRYILPMIRR